MNEEVRDCGMHKTCLPYRENLCAGGYRYQLDLLAFKAIPREAENPRSFRCALVDGLNLQKEKIALPKKTTDRMET